MFGVNGFCYFIDSETLGGKKKNGNRTYTAKKEEKENCQSAIFAFIAIFDYDLRTFILPDG